MNGFVCETSEHGEQLVVCKAKKQRCLVENRVANHNYLFIVLMGISRLPVAWIRADNPRTLSPPTSIVGLLCRLALLIVPCRFARDHPPKFK